MSIALAAAGDLPLANYRVFDSQDLDEARDLVGRIFCPHGLSTVAPGALLDARHHSAPLFRDASLNYVQYGAGVRIEPGYLRDFYLLQIPLRGGASVRCGGQAVESHPLRASFPSPSEPLSMCWHEDSPQLILKLDRAALQRRLEALLQAPAVRPLVFELGVALDAPGLGAVAGLIGYLRHAVEAGAFPPVHALLAEQAENHLLSTLLLATPHNYSDDLAPRDRRPESAAVLPRVVRRAQEFLSAHAEQPVTLAELCTQVGVSARALQQTFKQSTGDSPMAFFRDLRLDRVHAALRSGKAAGDEGNRHGATVGDAAARYGFFHLGHFAAHYRRRFGESPSDTLRRRL